MSRKKQILLVSLFLGVLTLGILTSHLGVDNGSFGTQAADQSLPPIPLQDAGEPTFIWWDGEWRYRTHVKINATSCLLQNTSIPVILNFTAALEEIGVSGEFDEDSLRVVEQNRTSGEVLHELPFHFHKFANYSAISNAQGILLFKLNGTTPLNTARSVFVYFDTADGTPKTPAPNSAFKNAWWAQYYPTTGTSYPDFVESLFVSPANLEHTTYTINYQDGQANNFPSGADGASPDWNNFAGNYTGYLWISSEGNYRFTAYSDDGTWLWINNTLVIENGGDHSYRNITAHTYLKEGIHPMRLVYYEHGGKGQVRFYWKPPSSVNYLLNGSVLSTFTYHTLMNSSAPPLVSIHETAASYVVRAHVRDTGGVAVQGTNVTIYNAQEELVRTGMTDQNGNVTFFLPTNGSYTLVAKNETDYNTVGGKIWVQTNWTFTLTVSDQGHIKDQQVTLPLATLELHFKDLDDVPFQESDDEHTYLRISNDTHGTLKTGILTDANGNITLYRIPVGLYNLSTRFIGIGRLYDYGDIPTQELFFSTNAFLNMILPLTSVRLQVLSYDSAPISGAQVSLTSQNYTLPPHVNTTTANGYTNFKRILNGTWTAVTTKTNVYNQEATNTTSITLQGSTPDIPIDLELTSLLVTVDDGSNPIAGANVTIYYPGTGGSKVTSASTNATGHQLFYHIRNGTYNVTVSFMGEWDIQNVALPSHYYKHNVTLSIIYEEGDSVLVFRNETYVNGIWNDNFTFIVAFINRTGSQPDAPITNPDWLNFTITYFGVPIYVGTLGSGVTNLGDGNYSLDIRTLLLKLNASSFPYIVKIEAFKTGFNAPEPVSFFLVIANASTSLTPNSTNVSVIWGELVNVYLHYNDTSHLPNLVIPDATVTFRITGGGYIRTGTLTFSGSGTYIMSLNSSHPLGLNLPAGSYTITFFATKQNYNPRTSIVTLTINQIPTILFVDRGNTSTSWDDTHMIIIEYNSTTAISGAQVNATWAYGVVSAIYSGGEYQIFIDTGVAPNGSYSITINAWKGNYTPQQDVFLLNISTRVTTITNVQPASGEITISWSQVGRFNITYYDSIRAIGIPGATNIITNWTAVLFSWDEVGNGIYQLFFDASVTPKNWTVEVKIYKANYAIASVTVKINILIPFDILPNGAGSIIDPATAYWTHDLEISVGLYNSYNPTQNITGATVTYTFAEGSGNILETPTLGLYNATLPARSITPGDFILSIYATAPGVSPAYGEIYVTILATPSALLTSNTTGFQYYLANLTFIMYWNNTLDNAPVSPSTYVNLTISHGGATLYDLILTPISGSPGYYSIELNTLELALIPSTSPYSLRFSAEMLGFSTPGDRSMDLVVNEVPTHLVAYLDRNEVELGRDTTVKVTAFYTNLIYNRNITGATLTASLAGQVYNMTGHANGTYTCVISIEGLSIDAYLITVGASMDYYVDAVVLNLQLEVKELTLFIPIIGPVPMSTVIVGAGGFGLPVLLFFGFVAYKRITMPYVLKVINKAIRVMQKGQAIDFEEFKLRSREDTINKILNSEYETLKMVPRLKPKPKARKKTPVTLEPDEPPVVDEQLDLLESIKVEGLPDDVYIPPPTDIPEITEKIPPTTTAKKPRKTQETKNQKLQRR